MKKKRLTIILLLLIIAVASYFFLYPNIRSPLTYQTSTANTIEQLVNFKRDMDANSNRSQPVIHKTVQANRMTINLLRLTAKNGESFYIGECDGRTIVMNNDGTIVLKK